MHTRTVLITGGSRGVGAATAHRLAAQGWDVHLTYRDKAARALSVVEGITDVGGTAQAHQLDVTDPGSVSALVDALPDALDVLILNASGGMEAGKPADYALRLNRDAQIALVEAVTGQLEKAAQPRVVFVTSHEAHFHGASTALAPYVEVAASKHAGEDALRRHLAAPEPQTLWLDEPDAAMGEAVPLADGVTLVVVSGDMITGTATATLLERARPGTTALRLDQVGGLPSTEDFGHVVARCAYEPVPHGVTVCLGGLDYQGGGASPFANV